MNAQTIDSPALQALVDEYHAKSTREGFAGLGDATEALAATRDYALRGWLTDFILRWESVEAAENYPETSEAAVFSAALTKILGLPGNASVDRSQQIARIALMRVRGLQTGRAAS